MKRKKNKLQKLEDGEHCFFIWDVREDLGIVTILYHDGSSSLVEMVEKKENLVTVPYDSLDIYWPVKMKKQQRFFVEVNDGIISSIKPHLGRYIERRALYSQSLARILEEEYGSVQGLFQYHEIACPRKGLQKQFYDILLRAQERNREGAKD